MVWSCWQEQLSALQHQRHWWECLQRNPETVRLGTAALQIISIGFIPSTISVTASRCIRRDWAKVLQSLVISVIKIYYSDYSGSLSAVLFCRGRCCVECVLDLWIYNSSGSRYRDKVLPEPSAAVDDSDKAAKSGCACFHQTQHQTLLLRAFSSVTSSASGIASATENISDDFVRNACIGQIIHISVGEVECSCVGTHIIFIGLRHKTSPRAVRSGISTDSPAPEVTVKLPRSASCTFNGQCNRTRIFCWI